MSHQVGLDSRKNLVVRLSGDLTPEEVSTVTDKMTESLKSLDKAYVLMDVTGLKNVSPKAREAMAKSPMPATEKIAVVCTSSMIRVLGTLVLKVIPKVKASRFFSTEEEAMEWLNIRD